MKSIRSALTNKKDEEVAQHTKKWKDLTTHTNPGSKAGPSLKQMSTLGPVLL